ncbi:hypothetical protein M9H77_14438 [Catharanthus roseus]|uniref:Uncharacterized protein n=1 Tax=Catharanthus roseus TaxID=4058 RepID=A0ACC0BN19_CATRO|nr:hypothetical protein M9H77_14438 [Catharanthus roseus]
MKPANLSCACCMYPYNLLYFLIQDSWAVAEDTEGTDDELLHRYGPCCYHWQRRTSTACQSEWASWSQCKGVPYSPSTPDIWLTKKTLISYY